MFHVFPIVKNRTTCNVPITTHNHCSMGNNCCRDGTVAADLAPPHLKQRLGNHITEREVVQRSDDVDPTRSVRVVEAITQRRQDHPMGDGDGTWKRSSTRGGGVGSGSFHSGALTVSGNGSMKRSDRTYPAVVPVVMRNSALNVAAHDEGAAQSVVRPAGMFTPVPLFDRPVHAVTHSHNMSTCTGCSVGDGNHRDTLVISDDSRETNAARGARVPSFFSHSRAEDDRDAL